MPPAATPSEHQTRSPAYVTTPIYYVNDRPHIGHCYTTLVADVLARCQRLMGRDVFFLTGTDEHADKVAQAAVKNGTTPQAWADLNAERFRAAFAFMGFTNDDFVRTSEARHTERVKAYMTRLIDAGQVELADYSGWYDPSQEEYLTESVAKEAGYKSPVTGRPLEKRVEQNYFFKLSEHAGWLEGEISSGRLRVLPEARTNEVLGRIRQGLQDVPVSRRIKDGDPDWGIEMPGDPEHRIYVWIDALCNYLTVIDNELDPATAEAEGGSRRRYWPGGEAAEPAPVYHLMAKDILWFHAVIWPCMLRAMGERPPSLVYAHAYWIAEGRKMSKSLGNFIEIDRLRAYAGRYSMDALRWFLVTQGPLGANDADFAHQRFVEVYNADLANGLGNAVSRVTNMIAKYFNGRVPDPAGVHTFTAVDGDGREVVFNWPDICARAAAAFRDAAGSASVDAAVRTGLELSNKVDAFIGLTRPFSIAKDIDKGKHPDPERGRADLAAILHQCAEALRVATVLMSPVIPGAAAEVARRWGFAGAAEDGSGPAVDELAEFAGGYGLKPGDELSGGDALFMRADADEPPPADLPDQEGA